MKEDLKNYKELNKRGDITFSSYFLLKMLHKYPKFYEELLIKECRISLEEYLDELESERLIRRMEEDEEIIVTVKGKRLFDNKNEIDEVIELFNQLKFKYLKISRKSKCIAEKSSINQRIKDYGLKTVKDVIEYKFNKWSKEHDMRHHLGSMTTLMKASSFDGFVNQLEIGNNEEIKRSKIIW